MEYIKFYSAGDLSNSFFLERIGTFLKSFEWNPKDANINSIIELFNIKQYFENNLRLMKWTDEEYDNYNNKTKDFEKIIATFFVGIVDQNFRQLFETVDVEYAEDFWFLFNRYQVYKRISQDVISHIIEKPSTYLGALLRQKEVVIYYGDVITGCLVKSVNSAQFLMDQFLENREALQPKLYFPKELTGELKEGIIRDYIRSDHPNPNYLKLIAESQSSTELPLHDKTKIEALHKYDDFVDSFFSESQGFSYGVEVAFDQDQKKIIIVSEENKRASVSYSTNWIEENLDYPTLLNNFIYLFEYVDSFFRSQFISQPTSLGTFERLIGVKGKNEYVTGILFNIHQMLTNAQMTGYYRQLLRFNIKLELVIKWFFEDYLSEEFGAKGFTFNAPSDNTTDLEKCKLLASEIDSVLKQFILYIEDGYIDRALFEMSSTHIKFNNVPSFLTQKYIYPNSEACKSNMQLLFSDQSSLAYTDKTQAKYSNFFLLLKNEAMNIADFKEYQRVRIRWLQQHKCIDICQDGFLKLNINKVSILKDLYENQVTCLMYLEKYKVILNEMLKSAEIKYGASLFSEPEQSYLNFILNKAEFSNGYDLRNRYSHGTYSLQVSDHKSDYIELLKIMVLIVIKINEEFCLREIHKVNSNKST